MIPISNDFKTAMKQPVKELQAYMSGDVDIKSEDDLISFKISCDSGLCKTAMRKLKAKYIGEHNLLGQWVHVGYGVRLSNGTFEYLDYGSFLVTEITVTKDTGITTIVGYDKMILSMKNYTKLEAEYPISLLDYTKLLCKACNLELGSVLLGNNAMVVEKTGINNLLLTNSLDTNSISFSVKGKSTQETRSGKNKFNGVTTNGYFDYDGTQIDANGWLSSTDYIEVFSQKDYIVSALSNATRLLYVEYNENKQVIGTRKEVAFGTKFTTLATTKYVRFSLNDTSASKIQLEEGTTATDYVPFEGGKAMPSPDYPSEIKSVGYENLFDGKLEQGAINESTGAIYVANTRLRSVNFNKIKPKTTYIFNFIGMGSYEIIEYDNNKKLVQISGWKLNNTDFTTSETTAFFKLMLRNGNNVVDITEYSNIQVEKGMVAHSYIPFGKYGIEVVNTSKNLFDTSLLPVTKNGVTISTDEKGNVILNGTPTISNGYINFELSGNVTLEPGTYTNSLNKKDGIGTYFSSAGVFNINMGDTINQKTGTISKVTGKFGVNVRYNVGTLNDYALNPQFEKGDKATEYQINKKTTLFVLNEPLRSTKDETVQDIAYIKNNRLYVERKIKNTILNGSETEFGYDANNNAFFYTGFNKLVNKPVNNSIVCVMSNYFNGETANNCLKSNYNYCLGFNTFGNLWFKYNELKSLDDFKNFLSTHNVQVQYELAEPIIEELGEIEMPLFKGINNISILDNLDLDTSITYYQSDDKRKFNKMNDWQVTQELWENIDNITHRDILVQIAQATGSTCIIGSDDKVYFKPLSDTREKLTYDNLFKLKLEPKYGAINSVVLSRTPQEDNIYMRDEESIQANGLTEFRIENNEIIDKDRDNAITPIYNSLKGITYYPFQATTEGLGWYEIGDKIDIINDTGDVFETYLFNLSISIDGSIKEDLKAVAENKTQTQYQYASTISKRVKNTEILTNKQQQYIEALITDMYEEDGVVHENFTKVYQDIDNIINSVQNSGGNNLIKNSVMFAYDDNNLPTNWEVSDNGSLIINSSAEALANGGLSGHVFTLLNKTVKQRVYVKQDNGNNDKTYYTFTTRIKKDKTGSCYVKLYNNTEEHIIELKSGESSFYKEYEIKAILPKTNYFDIEFFGSADSNATFTDNMLSIGEYKTQWTQASGEIMNTQVNINLDGVLVKSSVYLGDYTVMSPLEFAGYSNLNGTITKVFSLNKDTTLVKKLEAEDEVKMVPIKIVPITSGNVQGWAFVPSTKEV